MTAMEGAKKAKTEQAIVLGLLAVFAMTIAGTLKGMGFFRSPVPEGAGPNRPSVASQPMTPAPAQGSVAQARPPTPIPDSHEPAASKPSTHGTYTAHTLRDPLQTLLPDAPKAIAQLAPQPKGPAQPTGQPGGPVMPSTLAIQGVLWGGPEPKAIINDQVYGIGDVVQGGTIISISHEGVTIDMGGRKTVVAVSQETTKPSTPFTMPPQGRRR